MLNEVFHCCLPCGAVHRHCCVLQDVPMVIVSHDREFLDNLCTKIVETERGVATTYKVGTTAT